MSQTQSLIYTSALSKHKTKVTNEKLRFFPRGEMATAVMFSFKHNFTELCVPEVGGSKNLLREI